MCNACGQPILHRRRYKRSFSGWRPYVHVVPCDCPALRKTAGRSGAPIGGGRSTGGAWRGDRSVGAVVLSVRQVLEAVAELGEASLQLVCWELSVHEREARPAFERAIADGLLVGCGVDELHGEVIYALTEAGRNWLEGAS
jgi:hypothetical protein